MNAFRSRPPLRGPLAASLLALLITACGGSDDAVPVAAPTAAADAVTVAWNAPANIDVLANDSPGAGPIALTALTAPAHGSAAIVDGRLSYQPATGYFGADSLSYTITDGATGETASATVAITVQAQMKLQGQVADAPLASAQVTLRVGKAEFAATADASGQYEAAVTSTDGADFVVVEAAGAGPQAIVRLMSLVGDTATLAGRASTDGVVAGSAMPELNATHLSTALAVLAARGQGGAMPSTADALKRATAAVSGTEMLRLATFIRMIADKGVALPAGAADTLALLQDQAKLDAFASEQLSANWDLFNATQAEVLAEAPATARLDGLAATQSQTLVYLPPGAFASAPAVVTYRPDGTASLVYGGLVPQRYESQWKRDGSTLTHTLPTPIRVVATSALDPVTLEQYNVEQLTTGFVFRHLAGDTRAGTASFTPLGSETYLDGPFAGQPTPQSALSFGVPQSISAFVDLDDRLEINAADLAAGSRLGGVMARYPVVNSAPLQADILRFDSATAATLEVTGQAVTWSLADRWLRLTRAGGESMRYARLVSNVHAGMDLWIAIDEAGGADGAAIVSSVVRADPAPAFDAASATRSWLQADSFVDDPSFQSVFSIYADGSASQESLPVGVPATGSGTAYTWTIDAQRIALKRFNSKGILIRDRKWTLLRVQGNDAIVFEDFHFFNSDGSAFDEGIHRIRWLTDLGPATKP